MLVSETERASLKKCEEQSERASLFTSLSSPLFSPRTMHHFAAPNPRTLRARRAQPASQYEFRDSDSEEEEDDDDAPPQRRGEGAAGGRLRRVGDGGAATNAEAAGPRDAATVVEDIKQAVSMSLRQSSNREMELMDEVRKREMEGGR